MKNVSSFDDAAAGPSGGSAARKISAREQATDEQTTDRTGSTTSPSTRTATDTTADGVHAGGVTLRVVLLSLALAVFFGYIIPVIDMKTRNTFLGAAHLPPGAIAVLLALLLVINPLLRLLSRRLTFSRNEVLTVYITCLFSCLVPGHGAENFFVTNIIGPFYYATRENQWLEFLQPYLKPWLTPALSADGTYSDSGRAAIDGWFTGLRPDAAIPWGAWLVPLLVWGAFIFLSYAAGAVVGEGSTGFSSAAAAAGDDRRRGSVGSAWSHRALLPQSPDVDRLWYRRLHSIAERLQSLLPECAHRAAGD
jgi:hypothetical protein